MGSSKQWKIEYLDSDFNHEFNEGSEFFKGDLTKIKRLK